MSLSENVGLSQHQKAIATTCLWVLSSLFENILYLKIIIREIFLTMFSIFFTKLLG